MYMTTGMQFAYISRLLIFSSFMLLELDYTLSRPEYVKYFTLLGMHESEFYPTICTTELNNFFSLPTTSHNTIIYSEVHRFINLLLELTRYTLFQCCVGEYYMCGVGYIVFNTYSIACTCLRKIMYWDSGYT